MLLKCAAIVNAEPSSCVPGTSIVLKASGRAMTLAEGIDIAVSSLDSGAAVAAGLTASGVLLARYPQSQRTYLKFRDKIDLEPLTAESAKMRNPYSAIVVDSSKNASINRELAEALVDYLVSEPTQRAIAEYRVDGETLFHPARLDRD